MELSQFNRFVREDNTKVEIIQSDNVVIYTRVSSKEQAEKNMSLETQQKALEKFAAQNNLNVLERFGGTFESAKTDGRLEFNRMLEFVKKNRKGLTPVSKILVYSIDRFSRTGSKGAIAIADELRTKYGVRVFAVTQPSDTKNSSGRFQQNIQLLFSEYENELRREKCVQGMIDQFRAGIWCLRPPVGYSVVTINGNRKIEPDDNAKFIKKAFQWKAQGLKNDAIVKKLQALGFPIYNQKLHKVLKNPFYCGIIAVKMLNGEICEGVHAPLVTKELFLRVNEITTANRNYGVTHRKEFPEVPLKVFLQCDHCGKGMSGYVVKRKKLWYYKCRTKGCCSNHSAKRINSVFEGWLNEFKLNEHYVEPFKEMLVRHFEKENKESKELQKQLKERLSQVENKIDGIQEKHFVLETMPEDVYLKFHKKLVEEQTSIQQELKKVEGNSSNLLKYIDHALQLAVNLPSMWASGDYTTKEHLQRLVFPDGIYLNKEKQAVRTNKINSLFENISRFMGYTGALERGLITVDGGQSPQVELEGIEPSSKQGTD